MNKPPTLLQFKNWLLDVQIVWKHFIQDYNVIKACFWHNFKNNYLDNACAAALFYLTVCQDFIKVQDTQIDDLFKGIPLNAYKFRVEALFQMFGTTKESFNKAVYKIKVSADINSRQCYPNSFVTKFSKNRDCGVNIVFLEYSLQF